MSYRNDEENTRKYTPNFSVDEWIAFRERLNVLLEDETICDRNKRILTEIIVNMKSTAELSYLARTDEDYKWLISNQNKPISTRRIEQILTKYFPEFHIQTTHKKNDKNQAIRTEQNNLRQTLITKDSVCGKCGCNKNLQLHHMLEVSLGGDNDERNLIVLCQKCHSEYSAYANSKIKKILREMGRSCA